MMCKACVKGGSEVPFKIASPTNVQQKKQQKAATKKRGLSTVAQHQRRKVRRSNNWYF